MQNIKGDGQIEKSVSLWAWRYLHELCSNLCAFGFRFAKFVRQFGLFHSIYRCLCVYPFSIARSCKYTCCGVKSMLVIKYLVRTCPVQTCANLATFSTFIPTMWPSSQVHHPCGDENASLGRVVWQCRVRKVLASPADCCCCLDYAKYFCFLTGHAVLSKLSNSHCPGRREMQIRTWEAYIRFALHQPSEWCTSSVGTLCRHLNWTQVVLVVLFFSTRAHLCFADIVRRASLCDFCPSHSLRVQGHATPLSREKLICTFTCQNLQEAWLTSATLFSHENGKDGSRSKFCVALWRQRWCLHVKNIFLPEVAQEKFDIWSDGKKIWGSCCENAALGFPSVSAFSSVALKYGR